MLLESIIGALTGLVTRLTPEIIGYKDKKNERSHELKMAEYNLRLTELQNQGKIAIADREVEGAQFTSAMEAMKAGIEAQGKSTGIKLVDAINATVRPAITYWLFGLYSAAKTAQIHLALENGEAFEKAILAIWTENDIGLLSAVVTFFFVGRVWEKKQA